ncbi:MAG: phosphoglycerate kinase, partial [Acidimicrobiales bacterium]
YEIGPVRRRLLELVDTPEAVEVMENLRFSPGERTGDSDFVASLIEGQELFVNDAFGASHRSHASIVGPPQYLASAAGRLVEAEVGELEQLLVSPARPFVVLIGGAKVGDKLGLLRALAERADLVLVGGGMAFTFLQALGHKIGDSILDPAQLDRCRELLEMGAPLLLPVDTFAAAPGVEIADSCEPLTADGEEVKIFGRDLPHGWRGLDIGPATLELFREAIADAGTVMWNGPMGVFEDPRFSRGTRGVAEAVAATGARTVVGGGDSVAALNRFGLAGQVDHISTGGGASLALLEHGDLPGLQALRQSSGRRTWAP